MKSLLFFPLLLLLTSCAYKITRNYEAPVSKAIDSTCSPLILKHKNMFGLEIKYLGTILLDDSGNTTHCSENDAKTILQKEACLLNANIVNITDELLPNIACTCYRCVAEMFDIGKDTSIQKILLKEDRLTVAYNQKHKLDWSDFKTLLSDTSSIPYVFKANIELVGGNQSFWTGAYGNFNSQAVFYSDVSKIQPLFAIEKNKTHLDMLFYLSELYAKKLELILNKKENKTNNRESIEATIEQCWNELQETQKQYIVETAYGSDTTAQQKWNNQILKQMDELHIER